MRSTNSAVGTAEIISLAHKAAKLAFETHDQTDGITQSECGWARVVTFAPPRTILNSLKALGEANRDYNGAWAISDFSHDAPLQFVQNYRVQRIVHEAAVTALNAGFEGQAEFFVQSNLD